MIFARCPKQLNMWWLKILAHDIHMKYVGILDVVDSPSLCSLIFIGGQYSSKVQATVIVAYFVG